MEYQRKSHDHPYRRDSQQNPYDRGPSRGRGGNFRPRQDDFRQDNFRPREQNYRSRKENFRNDSRGFRSRDDRYQQGRGQQSRGNYGNFTRRNQGAWQNDERTFDHQGREIRGFEGPQTSFSQGYQKNPDHREYNEQVQDHTTNILSPLEEKAKDFFHTVLRQEGIRSKLIFLETVDNALQTLQGTVDYCQMQMTVDQDSTGQFVLKIDKEEIARGTFPAKQAAKNALAEQAMEILRKDCFYIVKKKVYEEVTTKKGEAKVEEKKQDGFAGSKAHQMMLKMGWGGKGLGVNEQGAEKTVAETLDQNVSRQGLGTDDVFKKIHKLLEDYSKSDKISLLRFDPDFTADERAHIHKIAAKFGLKSKSEGKGEQRRITITKKLHRGDLVYNLLTSNLENTLYKLVIPAKFHHLWNDDEADDDDNY